jgi:hypothetical protein
MSQPLASTGADEKYPLIINQSYRNNLAVAPAGPFFKRMDLNALMPSDISYRTSTVERKYVWQPHTNALAGIKLNLVDQESYLVQDRSNEPNLLDPADLRILFDSKKDSKTTTGTKASKGIDPAQRPFWLRNTTYLENNPFQKNQAVTEEAVQRKNLELKRMRVDSKKDIFSDEYIEASFTIVSAQLEKIQKQNPKRKLLAAIPVLPLDITDKDFESSEKHPYSLVKFDEDIIQLHQLEDDLHNHDTNNTDSSGSKQRGSKRFRHEEMIVTNIREPAVHDHRKQGEFHSTVVAPLQQEPEDPTQEDSQVIEAEYPYAWMRDYRMEVPDTNMNDSFMLIYDPVSQTTGYCAVKSRIGMKKMTYDSSKPHDCKVTREDF